MIPARLLTAAAPAPEACKSAHCRADLGRRRSGASPIIRPMLPSEESSAWVTLTRAPALDVPTLRGAIEILSHAQGIIEASDASRRRAGIPAAACGFLSSTKAALSAAERAWL